MLVKMYSSKIPSIMADEILLEQVFMNLILNSIQAMPDGGMLTITTRCERVRSRRKVNTIKKGHILDNQSSKFIEIIFSNTGSCIPQDIIGKIFEPFVTTKKNGVGLGLAIASRIINDHSGIIEVDNKRKKGAKFTVRLPIRRD
jgi:signal transduction histidine kinase